MTIPATPRRSPVYVGNGTATDYAFAFKVTDPATLAVTVADANDLNSQVLVNGVDYTVTLNGDQSASPGGSISYAGLPVGHRLVITSDTDSSQPTAISNLGAFHASVLEGALDRIVILHQQQQERLDRTLQVPVTSEVNPTAYLQASLDAAANSAAQAGVSAAAVALIPGPNGSANVGFLQSGAGAVARSVQEELRDLPLTPQQFGATGSGVNDDSAAVQRVMNSGARRIVFPKGKTYFLATTVTISADVEIDATGATILGAGLDSNKDLFSVASAVSVSVIGGNFQACRRAFHFTDADSIVVLRASFSDMVQGVSVWNTTSAGSLRVAACNFDAVEVGVNLQTSQFADVHIDDNRFVNIEAKTLTTRPAPLDKKTVAGLWYQSLTGASAVVCKGNYVDGVTGPNPAAAEPEVHGLAVTLDEASSTDVVIDSNVVRNVSGLTTSVEGTEGIMGRGSRVIVSNNVLFDAGDREGCIYAKASAYHKITGNVIEISLANPAIANTRGVISHGSNCDISGNKFVNTRIGILSRSLSAKYSGNEFVNCATYCITLALETGAVHERTVVTDNTADKDCGSFFVETTAGAVTRGDFIVSGNTILGKEWAMNVKGGATVAFLGNYVKRNAAGTERDLLVFSGSPGAIQVRNNVIAAFQNAGGTGRIFTGSAATPNLTFTGNFVVGGNYALWLRDQTYAYLIVRNNEYFDCTPHNVAAITVTGKNVIEKNVGVDL